MKMIPIRFTTLAILVVLLNFGGGCSASARRDKDAEEIRGMTVTVSNEVKRALSDRDVLKMEYLMDPVFKLLTYEALIIKSPPDQRPGPVELGQIKKKVDLKDYNLTLKKILTPEQFSQLEELRKKYDYAQFVTPPQ
jgi:hypothetical protein